MCCKHIHNFQSKSRVKEEEKRRKEAHTAHKGTTTKKLNKIGTYGIPNGTKKASVYVAKTHSGFNSTHTFKKEIRTKEREHSTQHKKQETANAMRVPTE